MLGLLLVESRDTLYTCRNSEFMIETGSFLCVLEEAAEEAYDGHHDGLRVDPLHAQVLAVFLCVWLRL